MDKNKARKYFNDRAAHWDEEARNNDPVKLKVMASLLQFPDNASILDVGTGTGVFVPYLKERANGKSRIICMDFAFNMLAIAKQKNGGGYVHHICSEVETLRFCCQLFDAVVCYSTFPHFHDKPLAMCNIHSLLKPGGFLYICHTASRETINKIHRNIPDFQDHLLPEKEEMTALLTNSGFKNTHIAEFEEYYLTVSEK